MIIRPAAEPDIEPFANSNVVNSKCCGGCGGSGPDVSPEPPPTPSVTRSVTVTPTPTVTNTPTITPTRSVTRSATPAVTSSNTPYPSNTPAVSRSGIVPITPTPSATTSLPAITVTATPSRTPQRTPTPSISVSVTPYVSPTPRPTKAPTADTTPTATRTATPSPTATRSSTPTRSATPTITATVTPSISASSTPAGTPGPSASVTPTITASVTISPSGTPSVSPTVSPTPSATSGATPSPTASVTPSNTPSVSVTGTPGVTPSSTPTGTSAVTPTASATPSVTATITPTISVSATPAETPGPSSSVTPTVTPSSSVTPEVTPSTTPSVSATPSPTAGATPSPTASVTASVTPSVSFSGTPGATPSNTPTGTSAVTPTPSVTVSVTPSITPTISVSATPAETPGPSATVTPTVTPSSSVTPEVTPSTTPSVSATPSPTADVTPSPTASVTPTITPTISVSATAEVTPTPTITPTVSVSGTSEVTPTPTPTPSVTVSPNPDVVLNVSAIANNHPDILNSYSQSLTATGGDGTYEYGVWSGALPPGLTLQVLTGIISGTPLTAGNYEVGFRVDSGGNYDVELVTIYVYEEPLDIGFEGAVDILTDTSIELVFNGTGGAGEPYEFTVPSITPEAYPELVYDSEVKYIYGYIRVPGIYTIPVTIHDSVGGTFTKDLVFTVTAAPSPTPSPTSTATPTPTPSVTPSPAPEFFMTFGDDTNLATVYTINRADDTFTQVSTGATGDYSVSTGMGKHILSYDNRDAYAMVGSGGDGPNGGNYGAQRWAIAPDFSLDSKATLPPIGYGYYGAFGFSVDGQMMVASGQYVDIDDPENPTFNGTLTVLQNSSTAAGNSYDTILSKVDIPFPMLSLDIDQNNNVYSIEDLDFSENRILRVRKLNSDGTMSEVSTQVREGISSLETNQVKVAKDGTSLLTYTFGGNSEVWPTSYTIKEDGSLILNTTLNPTLSSYKIQTAQMAPDGSFYVVSVSNTGNASVPEQALFVYFRTNPLPADGNNAYILSRVIDLGGVDNPGVLTTNDIKIMDDNSYIFVARSDKMIALKNTGSLEFVVLPDASFNVMPNNLSLIRVAVAHVPKSVVITPTPTPGIVSPTPTPSVTSSGTPLSFTMIGPVASTVGNQYAAQLLGVGGYGSGTYTYGVEEGNLPLGLTINRYNGVISGTPNTAGTYPVTLVVFSGYNKYTQLVTFEISNPLTSVTDNGIPVTHESNFVTNGA